MKRNAMVVTIACMALLFVDGCATESTSGRASTAERPIEERLKVGMTKEEVRAALGEPVGKSTDSSGIESWNYNDTAKMWIPFYAIGGGKFQSTIVNFDERGKVKNWSSSKQGLY